MSLARAVDGPLSDELAEARLEAARWRAKYAELRAILEKQRATEREMHAVQKERAHSMKHLLSDLGSELGEINGELVNVYTLTTALATVLDRALAPLEPLEPTPSRKAEQREATAGEVVANPFGGGRVPLDKARKGEVGGAALPFPASPAGADAEPRAAESAAASQPPVACSASFTAASEFGADSRGGGGEKDPFAAGADNPLDAAAGSFGADAFGTAPEDGGGFGAGFSASFGDGQVPGFGESEGDFTAAAAEAAGAAPTAFGADPFNPPPGEQPFADDAFDGAFATGFDDEPSPFDGSAVQVVVTDPGGRASVAAGGKDSEAQPAADSAASGSDDAQRAAAASEEERARGPQGSTSASASSSSAPVSKSASAAASIQASVSAVFPSGPLAEVGGGGLLLGLDLVGVESVTTELSPSEDWFACDLDRTFSAAPGTLLRSALLAALESDDRRASDMVFTLYAADGEDEPRTVAAARVNLESLLESGVDLREAPLALVRTSHGGGGGGDDEDEAAEAEVGTITVTVLANRALRELDEALELHGSAQAVLEAETAAARSDGDNEPAWPPPESHAAAEHAAAEVLNVGARALAPPQAPLEPLNEEPSDLGSASDWLSRKASSVAAQTPHSPGVSTTTQTRAGAAPDPPPPVAADASGGVQPAGPSPEVRRLRESVEERQVRPGELSVPPVGDQPRPGHERIELFASPPVGRTTPVVTPRSGRKSRLSGIGSFLARMTPSRGSSRASSAAGSSAASSPAPGSARSSQRSSFSAFSPPLGMGSGQRRGTRSGRPSGQQTSA